MLHFDYEMPAMLNCHVSYFEQQNVLTGGDLPSLADFNKHVRPLIAAHWEDVGVQLLSEHNQSHIAIIKANCHGDVEKCCTNLFDVWTQRQPDHVTWLALIEAVKNAGLVKEAEKIEKLFLISSGRVVVPQIVWPKFSVSN